MASANRLWANRQNAQKSTGPKTEAGKARSRSNSLKHGLTGAGVVLAGQDCPAVRKKLGELRTEIEPQGSVENTLVERMAVATVRLKRSQRAEQARLTMRRRRTLAAFRARRLKALERSLALFAQDPMEGLHALSQTVLGCRWIKQQWEELRRALEEQGSWSPDQRTLAQRLSGCDLGEPNENGDGDPARTREGLLALASQSVASYHDREVRLFESLEKPERACLIECALVDCSHTGMRLARYEAMNDLTLHRNWSALVRLRKLAPALFPGFADALPDAFEDPAADAGLVPPGANDFASVAEMFREPAEAAERAPSEAFWEASEAFVETCEPPAADDLAEACAPLAAESLAEPMPEPAAARAQNEPNDGHSSAAHVDIWGSSPKAHNGHAEPVSDGGLVAVALLERLDHPAPRCAEPASCS